MAAYLRPRRGTASGSTVVLKEGEIFLDTAKSSSATTLSSWGQIYVGNNSANINALKPFVALPKDMVINDGISATGNDSNIANNNSLSTIISAIKNELKKKVSKTGGTMTGYLRFESAGIQLGTTDSSGDDISWYQFNSTGYKRIIFGNIIPSNIELSLPSTSGMLVNDTYLNSNYYGKLKVFADTNAKMWKTDSPSYHMSWFIYEGANTTTYDLPVAHCIVVVYKYTSARGVAMAYQWASNSDRIWKNTCHDTWRGWLPIK